MITRKIPPPRVATWGWRVLWGIAWILKQFSARLEVEGLENLPATGGFIVTCNHTRGFDFVPLGFSSPRQVYFMVKAEAFRVNALLTYILREGGGIPVQRGKADMRALQVAVDKLNDGYPLAIFPEGTRSPDGTLQAAHTGAVRIAMHTGVLIIPAVVIGAVEMLDNFWKPWVRPRVLVRFGAPLQVAGDPADRAQVHAETMRMMRTMAAMLPVDMRGMWQGDGGRVIVPQRERKDQQDVPDHGAMAEPPSETRAPLAAADGPVQVGEPGRDSLVAKYAPQTGEEDARRTGDSQGEFQVDNQARQQALTRAHALHAGPDEPAEVAVEEEVDDVR